MFRQVITCSAAVGLVAAVAGGFQPSAAQDVDVVMFGTGPDRICNVLMTQEGLPVLESEADAVVTEHTYDCPEEVMASAAVIEPARRRRLSRCRRAAWSTSSSTGPS